MHELWLDCGRYGMPLFSSDFDDMIKDMKNQEADLKKTIANATGGDKKKMEAELAELENARGEMDTMKNDAHNNERDDGLNAGLAELRAEYEGSVWCEERHNASL